MPSTVVKRVTDKGKSPKATKLNKTKASAEKKPKGSKASSTSHPPYFQMIKEAIVALHERTGSSPHAIAKYMEEKHKGELNANFRKVLAIQLKNLVISGKLLKVKASFKLSESGKQGEKKVVKDAKPKVASKVKKPKTSVKVSKPKSASTPVKRKASLTVKKPVVTGKAVKKAPVVKKVKSAVKSKQPKSIKSPAAKRARKAVA